MQTRREIVKAAIEFRTPDRLPIMNSPLGESDVYCVNWKQKYTGDNSKKLDCDEWGCGWVRTEMKNMGQVKHHPLLDWEAWDEICWPDPDDPELYSGMEQHFKNAGDRYIYTEIFYLLFERMHALRGFENILTDLYLEPEKTAALADKIVDFNLGVIENIGKRFPGRIDGLSCTDDWGTEKALFINPDLWRQFFKPRYKRIFDACHKNGWHVWLHSCGRINDIIGDLIEAGCDVLNLQQPLVLGIEEIGKAFAGKVCFRTTCDIQRTLPSKGRAEIEYEAKLLLDYWATDEGGIICSDYGDGTPCGISYGNRIIMDAAFKRYDPWKKTQS